jgi:hypothetical protein
VEELAHLQHGTLETPAVAFTALALCGARRLVVRGHGGSDRDGISPEGAATFLALAPLNVSQLLVKGAVSNAQWDAIAAALDCNRCHSFMRSLGLPAGRPCDAAEVAALLTATNGLAHLRSLQCGGTAGLLVDAMGTALRRLALVPAGTATQHVTFDRVPALRRIGPVSSLSKAVTAIDLCHLRHLVRVDDQFGFECCGLRSVLLPATVTSIGDHFVCGCANLTAVLDLSHLTKLRSVGASFAQHSSLPGVLLPPNIASLDDHFLFGCKNITAALDLRGLVHLQSIGTFFAAQTAINDVRLPPSVTSIGADFIAMCTSITQPLDLSHLTLLRGIVYGFARQSTVPDVRLPFTVASIGDRFLYGCMSLSALLDLSRVTQLRCIGAFFAARSSVPGVLLPRDLLEPAGEGFLFRCLNAPRVRTAAGRGIGV